MNDYDINILERQFERVGANLRVEPMPMPRRTAVNPRFYTLDVRDMGRRKGETFLLHVRADALPHIRFQVLNAEAHMRHLLLLATPETETLAPVKIEPGRFLCGHDERHWFVAAVKSDGLDAPSSVGEAMEALKPGDVALRQRRAGVRVKDWNRRKNAGFLRQGEWFFLPEPDFTPNANAIIYNNEPIRRSNGSKAHTVELLHRSGGEMVWVSPDYPHGLREADYKKVLEQDAIANRTRSHRWQPMRRNPEVYAKGKIRHPDHATITLPFWHRVQMNGEVLSQQVVFLD